MQKLTAIREVRYAGINYAAGQSFEASEKDAKLLVAVKKAVYGGAPANKTDLPKAAAPEVIEEPAPLPEAPTYWRRDMTAGGLTGEEASPPSSRRGRPRKQSTSDFSEDDAE